MPLLIGMGMKVVHRLAAQAFLAADLVLTASSAALALAALISQWSFEQGQLHPQRTWWWSAMSAQIL